MPDAKVFVLPRTHGDHHPFLLDTPVQCAPVDTPFRCQTTWMHYRDFPQIFQYVLEPFSHSPSDAIRNVCSVTEEWNKVTFGNIFKNKRRTLARLRGIHRVENPDRQHLNLEAELTAYYA